MTKGWFAAVSKGPALGQNSNVIASFTSLVRRQLLKTTLILVPLLGFTWIIGLFAVGEEGRVFAYLFVIANVFQVRSVNTSCSIYIML